MLTMIAREQHACELPWSFRVMEKQFEVCALCRLSPKAAGENIAWSKVAGVENCLRHELETGQKTAG